MEQVDNYTQQLNDMVSLGESLQRLKKNKDFKKIVAELYLSDGADILTKNLVRVKDRENLMEQFVARSWLYDHFDRIDDEYSKALEELSNIDSEGE
jgi:hypothetical protein